MRKDDCTVQITCISSTFISCVRVVFEHFQASVYSLAIGLLVDPCNNDGFLEAVTVAAAAGTSTVAMEIAIGARKGRKIACKVVVTNNVKPQASGIVRNAEFGITSVESTLVGSTVGGMLFGIRVIGMTGGNVRHGAPREMLETADAGSADIGTIATGWERLGGAIAPESQGEK